VPDAIRQTAQQGTIRAFQAQLPDEKHHLHAIIWLSPSGWRAQVSVFTNLVSPFPPNESIPASRTPTVEELADAVALGPRGVEFALPFDGTGILGTNAVLCVELRKVEVPAAEGGG
jgi:hypothetical protein